MTRINMENDIKYMKTALALAKKGMGKVNPNPMVGAVIVKDNNVISKGFHKSYGSNHAERNAIINSGTDLSGATIYVNLEPCCHYGKTPPCTDLIIKSGISRVVIASKDPNPLVSGKGIQILKNNGIDVDVGICHEDNLKLNEVFFHYIKNKSPFIAMKYAMTLDGKISTKSGASKWITSEDARKHTHFLRNKYMSILVGINTVLADDPMLNCRYIKQPKNPIRIICDSKLRIPLNSNILRTAGDMDTIIATCSTDVLKIKAVQSTGANVLTFDGTSIPLRSLFSRLGQMGIDSILVEGGNTIHGAIADRHMINKLYVYLGNRIFGGPSPTPIGGIGVESPALSDEFEIRKIRRFKNDVLIESYPLKEV